jgi:hypothetical protein
MLSAARLNGLSRVAEPIGTAGSSSPVFDAFASLIVLQVLRLNPTTPLGVTLWFLIASPMIVLAGVIGWQLAAAHVLTGPAVAFVGGFVLERFRPESWVED